VVEAGRAGVLRRVGVLADSEALQADATNRLSDVISTVGVLAGLVRGARGFAWADAAAALLVAAIIARTAVMLIWRSGDILIDRAPAGAEAKLREAILRVNGVREVRSVRVRRSGPDLLGDASVATRRMLPVEAAGAIVDEIKRVARELFQADLTVLVEGQARASDLVERIHATARARRWNPRLTQRDGRARERRFAAPDHARQAARRPYLWPTRRRPARSSSASCARSSQTRRASTSTWSRWSRRWSPGRMSPSDAPSSTARIKEVVELGRRVTR